MTILSRVKVEFKPLILVSGLFLFSLLITDDVRSQSIHLNEVM